MVCRVVADTIEKKRERRQLSGEGGSWSVVVERHRHPRFMASHGSHGWADWVDWGAWQGAQSALRCPWSREQLPGGCQSVVAGAGGQVGVRSFPGRSTERWASPLVTKGEGGRSDGLVAFGLTPPVKEN